MEKIVVHNQKEMNEISIEFDGVILVKGGNSCSPILVTKKYLYPVEAWENSSVEAWGNSSVEAWGNCQIADKGTKGKLTANGNSRIVHDPKTIYEYCNFHGIEVNNGAGKFFKAVHKNGSEYFSDHNKAHEYKIGEISLPDFFDNSTKEQCGHGIHVAHKAWAIDFGKNWNDIAILEVEANLEDIVVPDNCGGKARCKSVKVLREVPLEECGLYGKMIAKCKASR